MCDAITEIEEGVECFYNYFGVIGRFICSFARRSKGVWCSGLCGHIGIDGAGLPRWMLDIRKAIGCNGSGG